MKLHRPAAEIFVPDGLPKAQAMKRVTHLGIGAHPDDLEFMAFHGILECYASDRQWFGGVTCSNGSGSARTGIYKSFSNADMIIARRREQNAAAVVGKYGVMIQLDYSGSTVNVATSKAFKDDLKKILTATKPGIVYTHNPADKHDAHVGVVDIALQAMRELPRNQRPKKVWGCEVWRSLDWLPDADKVPMNVSGHDNLAAALNGIFDSQIAGGKRYDLATLGRRSANATFFEPHATDATSQLIFGMDLTPLVRDETLDVGKYVCGFIDKFRDDVRSKWNRRFKGI